MFPAFRLAPSWKGNSGIEARNAPTFCCTGTNSQMLSAYQRAYSRESDGACSYGSARRFTIIGQFVTSRTPIAMFPVMPAINIRCLIAHHAVIVGTDVAPADVIPPMTRMLGLPAVASAEAGFLPDAPEPGVGESAGCAVIGPTNAAHA